MWHFWQRAIFCPRPDWEGVLIISGSVVRAVTLLASMTALRAKEEPVSCWHPVVLVCWKDGEEREGTATVTAVHDERFGFHAVSYMFAIAAAF
jgi:hypothetical protein